MKHAIAKNENGGAIKINANVENHNLHIELSDTGNDNQEVSTHNKTNSTGVGLTNINQRLKALYQDKYRITTHMAKNSGLMTKIVIPIE